MCRLPILMAMACIGFILLVASLPTADCSGNGKEKMEGSNTNEMENAPANESDDDDIAFRNIFVGQLPYSTSDETLREYFKQFGEVENAYIIRNRPTYESKGYGFVTMKDKEGADRALGKPEPKIDGRFVKINFAAKKHNKDLSNRLNSMNQLSKSEDHDKREIFVGGLSFDTTNETLDKYFEQFGNVEEAVVKKDRTTGISLGYGFVLMKDNEGANRALKNLNPMIDGRFVDVNLASKPENNKHLSARLNSMNRLPLSQKTNPTNDGQRANANLTSLRAKAQSYTPLASSSTSMNQSPQLQWRRKENPNPNTAGQTSNKPSAYLVANPHNNTPLANHSNSAYQNSAPQNSHYMIFENENGKFFQPGILHPPATQNSHYMIFDTPNGTLAHPLPNLAARQFQRSLTRHLSMLNSRAATGGQQSRTNVGIEQPPQPASRLPAYGQTKGTTGQKHPITIESEANEIIEKQMQRPKSAPVVLQATGTTNNNLSSYNNEQWFERYSVKRNKSERNNQQNKIFDNNKNKKDSAVKGKKPIEEVSAGIEKNTEKIDDPQHASHDEPNSALKAELMASEKFGGAASVPESSSKVEDGKMSWADMVEEEEKENQQNKKETTKAKEEQIGHHPTMVAQKHEAAGGKAESEAEKTNVDAIVEHHKNQKLQTMVFDDNKNYEEQKHKNVEKIPTAKDEKHIGGHSPHQKLETKVFDDNKKDSNMIEDKFPNVKEEMSVGDHSPKDQGDKFNKDNANNPIKNDEVLDVSPKKSYLNVAQTPKIVSKKNEMVHSMRASTSKIGSEDANKKKNLADKVKEIERKGQESDEKREIFVGQLAYSATEETLQEYFQQFGDVEKVIVVVDPKTKKSRGFGFVWMKEEKDVKKACENPNPTINGRPVYLEAYEGAKRKNKRFSTPSNSSNQFSQHLQEGQKEKPNLNVDGRKAGMNPSSNMHLAAPSEKIEKHSSGNFPIEQDDKLSKENVNKPKSDEVLAEPRKKSYLNVAKTPPPASKKYDVKHPTSTSKIVGEDGNKMKNLVEKVEEDEKNEKGSNYASMNKFSGLETNEYDGSKLEMEMKNEDMEPKKKVEGESSPTALNSERQSYASALLKKKSENQPTMAAQTHMETGVKAKATDGEAVKSDDTAIAEQNKIPQEMLQNAQNLKMEEMPAFEEMAADDDEFGEGNENTAGENSSPRDPIHPSSPKGKGNRGVGKEAKRGKKEKGAKKVGAKKNESNQRDVADMGDSSQILEKENQKKSLAKNQSADTGTSSIYFATVAKQRLADRAMKRAQYLGTNLIDFQYKYFMNHENAMPKTNKDYELLIDDALGHLNGETTVKIVKIIKRGLQGRHLKYIRLIGAGSLRQQIEPNLYDKEIRDVDVAALKLLENGVGIGKNITIPGYILAKEYRLQRQLFAIYQLALVKRIAELFRITPEHVTVEEHVKVDDMHFDESEKNFLTKVYKYTTILNEDGMEENLVEIPSQVAEMSSDDVTLIIILNCSLRMTTDLINSYGEHSKQLILMESTMHDRYDNKHSNKEDKKNFQQNREKFQIRKPLPTILAEHVFEQNDVNNVQICYADLDFKKD